MAYHEVGEETRSSFCTGTPHRLICGATSFLMSQQKLDALPDLIGQGDSDKLDDVSPGTYRFVDHREYLDGLLDQLDLGDQVTFVIHDWGSALGFDWAYRHQDRVAGIAYMEGIVTPIPVGELR